MQFRNSSNHFMKEILQKHYRKIHKKIENKKQEVKFKCQQLIN